MNQDSQDPGWWYGELNGQTGVFPDNFVVILSHNSEEKQHKVDKKYKAAQENTSSIAQQRKSLEKTEKTDGEPNKTSQPPLPGKKPIIPIKKSPSSGSSSGGLFSGKLLSQNLFIDQYSNLNLISIHETKQ